MLLPCLSANLLALPSSCFPSIADSNTDELWRIKAKRRELGFCDLVSGHKYSADCHVSLSGTRNDVLLWTII